MIFFVTIASAKDPVVAIPEGEEKPILGPAVCMTEARFTEFLSAERLLPICQKGLEQAAEASIRADQRTLSAYAVVSEQFRGDEKLVVDMQAQVTTLSKENEKLRGQRNLLLGIAAGLGAGCLTASILVAAM